MAGATQDSFGAKGELEVGGASYQIYRLDALEDLREQVASLPFSLKILLENLLRTEDGANVTGRPRPGARRAGTRRPSRTPRSSSPRPAW